MQISISNAIGGGGGAKGGTPAFSNTKSILLDGIDDRVDVTPVSVTGNEFSVSFWMKPSSFNNRGPVGSNTPNILSIHIYTSSTIRLYLQGGSNVTLFNFGGNLMTLNQWQHIIICRDSNNVTKCYRNGVLFNDGGATSVVNGTFHLNYIGARNSVNTFNGSLDEVAYWDSDQSANASAIYNSGVPASLDTYNPLGWWRCGDDDTAPTLTDNGSGGNDGTMINFSTFSTDVPT